MRSTPPAPPSSPYTTCFSGSTRENRERLHNICTGGRKRPGKWLFPLSVLVMLLCCFCLVSCRQAPAATEPEAAGAPSADPSPSASVPFQELVVDLNHNGIPEEIRPEISSVPARLTFWENEQCIAQADSGVYLCTLDGRDYLLRSDSEVSGGSCFYSYALSDPTKESDDYEQYGWLRFDLAFNALYYQEDYDPEEIAAYVESLNALLAHSVQLSLTDENVVTQPAQPETLPWLDDFPEVFVRDPEKTLAENLEAYRTAMAEAYPAASPQAPVDALPLAEPIEMIYASGAGAWGSWLELNPDGTFTGDYSDTDMNIRYVCQFHGSFSDIRPLTDASWLLTLGELTLDTPYPLGSEWYQDGMRMVSSQPHGFDGRDGETLRPGAQFIFYTPQAQGHAPWTELYGASNFLSWWFDRRPFVNTTHTLGCYGLNNLEIGIGYFSRVSGEDAMALLTQN